MDRAISIAANTNAQIAIERYYILYSVSLYAFLPCVRLESPLIACILITINAINVRN